MIQILIFIASLFIVSCGSSGPHFDNLKDAPKNTALIYVYRPSRFGGAARSPDVYSNSTKLGTIRNNGYFSAETRAGENILQLGSPVGDKTRGIHANLKAGETYFFRIDFSLNGFDKSTRPDGTTTNKPCGNPGMPFFKMLTSNDEIKKLLAGMDTRVNEDVCSPGLMFVTKEYALDELKETKESK